MSRMSFMEWVGLIIVLVVLIDFFQNDGYGWFDHLNSGSKQAVSKKSSH